MRIVPAARLLTEDPAHQTHHEQAVYLLNSTQGELRVNPRQITYYKNLELIGRDTENWNRPLQQNFVTPTTGRRQVSRWRWRNS